MNATHPNVLSAAREVAEIARANAESVDASGRLPTESVRAMRESGLLGSLARSDSDFRDIARATSLIAEGCSSSGSIFAMHQSQVATLLAHGTSPVLQTELQRVAADEVLIASCLSENTTGGDPGKSSCYIDPVEGEYAISKQSPAISYGSIADAIMVSARRGADAEPHDQVLVYCTAPAMDVLEVGAWDSLGMRGTGSSPFSLNARVTPGHIFNEPFAVIGAQTMIPSSHVLWAACWLGIAREAVRRTLAYLRNNSDRGTPLETSRDLKLARARRLMSEMASEIDSACARLQDVETGLVALRTGYFNSLKLRSSESLVEIVTLCLQLVGITGYLNSGPFSLARLLRDSHSAPLMVSNQRIELNNARGARMPLEAV